MIHQISGIRGEVCAAFSVSGGAVLEANFGAKDYAVGIPSGFQARCSPASRPPAGSPAARPLRMARGPCISIRTHARITSGNHQGDKHHVSVPPRCNTPGHHQGERLAVSGRRLAGRGPVSGSRSVRSQMIDSGGMSDGAS